MEVDSSLAGLTAFLTESKAMELKFDYEKLFQQK